MRRNPADRADQLAQENRELRSQLDRVAGIAEASDSIDSEDGLRRSLGRIARVVGIDEEETDDEAEAEDFSDDEDIPVEDEDEDDDIDSDDE